VQNAFINYTPKAKEYNVRHEAVDSSLDNEIAKFLYKVTPAEFKRFKNANKAKYYFIFSASIDRWLVTDRTRKLPSGLFQTIGRYYPAKKEFRSEERIEGFSEFQAGPANAGNGS
jgi:hypothetical protein